MSHHVQYADRNVSPRDYKAVSPRGSLWVTKIWPTIQGEGPFAGHRATFIRLAGCNKGNKESCPFCFPATEMITTRRGAVRFGDVVVGDELITLNNSLQPTFTTVTRVLKRYVPRSEMVRVAYRTPSGRINKLTCTKEHPFHRTDGCFVAAEDLIPGDVIYHIPGDEMQSFLKRHNNPMHNLVVAQKVGRSLRAAYLSGQHTPYTRTEKQRKALSEHKKTNNPMFNPESVLSMIRTKMQRGQYKKSNLEYRFEALFSEFGYNVQWVGDDPDYIIGDNNTGYILPDFVVVGTKKLIEVYDRTNQTYAQDRYSETGEVTYRESRRAVYKKFGYDVLFLTPQSSWTHPGKGYESSYEPLRTELGSFVHNGIEIISVSPLSGRGKGPLTYEVVNFSCAPYNTFCFRGIHTHNCDTFFKFDEGQLMAFTYLKDEISKWSQKPGIDRPFVVVTGGEPMLQDNLGEFIPYINQHFRAPLETAPKVIQIESNGDRLCRGYDPDSAWLVVSPKVNPRTQRYQLLRGEVVEAAMCLKYVIEDNPYSPYYDVPIQGQQFLYSGRDVYISPMTVYKRDVPRGATPSLWDASLVDQERTAKNYKRVSQLSMEYGYKVSIQTHLLLSVE